MYCLNNCRVCKIFSGSTTAYSHSLQPQLAATACSHSLQPQPCFLHKSCCGCCGCCAALWMYCLNNCGVRKMCFGSTTAYSHSLQPQLAATACSHSHVFYTRILQSKILYKPVWGFTLESLQGPIIYRGNSATAIGVFNYLWKIFDLEDL